MSTPPNSGKRRRGDAKAAPSPEASTAPTLAFTRPFNPDVVKAEDVRTVEIEADESERVALARWFDAQEVSRLGARFEITRWRGSGLLVSGTVSAALTQACVVTLSPVPALVEETVSRRYLPERKLDRAPDTLDPFGEDPPEALPETLDLAAIAAETVALALEPYPRAEGAELGEALRSPAGATALDDPSERPFAKLAALKERLEKE